MNVNDAGAWTRILEYRDFYDVPRAFVIEPKPELLLFFDCPFDEAADEYPSSYTVSVLRHGALSDLPTDWRGIGSLIVGSVGVVPVAAVRFDESRRREVFVETLIELVAAAERLLDGNSGSLPLRDTMP